MEKAAHNAAVTTLGDDTVKKLEEEVQTSKQSWAKSWASTAADFKDGLRGLKSEFKETVAAEKEATKDFRKDAAEKAREAAEKAQKAAEQMKSNFWGAWGGTKKNSSSGQSGSDREGGNN